MTFETSVPGPWRVDSIGRTWIIVNTVTGRTKNIGPVSKPRGQSKVNYFDRAVEEAERRNRETPKQRPLGKEQRDFLCSLVQLKQWTQGCGWLWRNDSRTLRLLDSLVKRGLAEVVKRPHRPSAPDQVLYDHYLPTAAGLEMEQSIRAQRRQEYATRKAAQ